MQIHRENAFRAPIRRFWIFRDLSCHHFHHRSDYFYLHANFVLAFVHSLWLAIVSGSRDFASVSGSSRHTLYAARGLLALVWAILLKSFDSSVPPLVGRGR